MSLGTGNLNHLADVADALFKVEPRVDSDGDNYNASRVKISALLNEEGPAFPQMDPPLVNLALLPRSRQRGWTMEEDLQLAKAVATNGRRWTRISKILGRTRDQCRERWRLFTDPTRSTRAHVRTRVQDPNAKTTGPQKRSTAPKAPPPQPPAEGNPASPPQLPAKAAPELPNMHSNWPPASAKATQEHSKMQQYPNWMPVKDAFSTPPKWPMVNSLNRIASSNASFLSSPCNRDTQAESRNSARWTADFGLGVPGSTPV
eukprot:CAMPEP_0117064668 /NCGR_PEP_ID=MMETSP0472-20121206/45175_1 /TAXON_ID=693140 ORGANISM="Tiarina fusus, Strain LIS" /NCGR_SAMPLE_ID=MMETSP0472 /ASSEMBLY_ACC=CAM_ASM_000603 /LENGTH=259 /DNA_ID=CAMNT_0004784921 /DNA_START=8 /DNA_END=787 /DNA_ORIENTATION=-